MRTENCQHRIETCQSRIGGATLAGYHMEIAVMGATPVTKDIVLIGGGMPMCMLSEASACGPCRTCA